MLAEHSVPLAITISAEPGKPVGDEPDHGSKKHEDTEHDKEIEDMESDAIALVTACEIQTEADKDEQKEDAKTPVDG